MNFRPTLKNALITLSSIAGVLAVISFYVVFYANTGTYVVNSDGDSSQVFSTSTVATASSTASSSLALASSSASASSSTASNASSSQPYSVNYATPPVTWSEGNEAMAITGASLTGSQLTLDVQVTMGSASECVPLNLRIVTDENGDLAPPATSQFMFPDSGTCTGTAGEIYTGQQVVFSVDPTAMPFILNTGGASNKIFEVDTDTSGNLTVELPPSAD